MSKSRWKKSADRKQAAQQQRKVNRHQLQESCRSAGYIVLEDGTLEHRAVWQQHHGKIPKGWVVHHINECKYDNRIENLLALPAEMHDALHKAQRKFKKRFSKASLEALVAGVREDVTALNKEILALEIKMDQLKRQRDSLRVDIFEQSEHLTAVPLDWGPPPPPKAEPKVFTAKIVRRSVDKPDLIVINSDKPNPSEVSDDP